MTKELSSTITARVREKLDKINDRLSKMETAKNAGPKTNGIFSWNGREDVDSSNTGSIKINAVSNIALLISIFGFLLTRKAEYDLSAEKLDMVTYPVFTWSKYPIDAWENDIKARINTITHHDEIERLTKLKGELSKYVSEEDRVKELLSQILD